MDGAAEIAIRVGMQISKGRVFLAGLMVRERIVHDRVLRYFRQGDVLAHVFQVPTIVLAKNEKLPAVAKHG